MSSSARAATRSQVIVAVGLLLVLHFYIRPRVFDGPYAPDFVLIALILFALRNGPGAGAVAGFLVGLANDALVPARFGAAMLAHTLVGYLAAWSRAIFFADNVLVNAGFLFFGCWLRDLIVLLASGLAAQGVLSTLFIDMPLRGLSTAVAGTVLLIAFRQLFAVRLDQ